MILSFNPAGLSSSAECVEFLRQKGLVISQKLGARILALSVKGVQFSLAALEDAPPGSAGERLFLSREMVDASHERADALKLLIAASGMTETFSVKEEQGLVKIISPFEEEIIHPSPGGTMEIVQTQQFTTANLLAPTSISPHSILSDRRYLEEMALNFLDSDDPTVIVESLRKLTRIILLSSRDPSALFVAAFSKDKPEIWRACATVIKETIDGDFGLMLEQFLNENDFHRKKEQFGFILQEVLSRKEPQWGEILLLLLTRLLGTAENLPLLMENLRELSSLIAHYPQQMKAFIRNILAHSAFYSPEELNAVRDLLLSAGGEYPLLSATLLAEAEKNNPAEHRIVILWFLSPLSLTPPQGDQVIAIAKKLVRNGIRHPHLQNMLKTAMLRLAPRSLAAMSSDDFYKILDPEMRFFIIELWNEYYWLKKGIIEGKEAFLKIFVSEITSVDQVTLKKLLRLKILHDREVLSQAIADPMALIEASVWTFTSYQYDEERDALFSVLIKLAPQAVRICFELVKKRYALDEEISDHLIFLGTLIAHTHGKNSPPPADIIQFLLMLSRERKAFSTVAFETLGIIFRSAPWKKTEVTAFLKRALQRLTLPFTVKIRILFQLFDAACLTDRGIAFGEHFILERLKLKDIRSDELSALLEELNLFLGRGSLTCTGELVALFSREIALKLTSPTIGEIMRNDALAGESSRFLGEYERNPWSWDDVAQTLFILTKIAGKRDQHGSRESILSLFAHVARHWQASRTLKESRFLVPDAVLFRNLKEMAEMGGHTPRELSLLGSITESLLLVLKKSQETPALPLHDDLQDFLFAVCTLWKAITEGEPAALALDPPGETVRYLLSAWRSGSSHAAGLLERIAGAPWAAGELKKRIRNALS
ncbi:MAG: hypothetical protein RDV48_15955 [Candidatus Eremiobacteraeota bacterium]|nr:hypothetical protein [Candidatus Eremiobacteraeota bacterium]